MKVKIYPDFIQHNEVTIPPSKSFAHRAIICASLSEGVSKLEHIDYSEDILATINAVKVLGAKVEMYDTYLYIQGVTSIKPIGNTVDVNESGSTLRFMIPIFALAGFPIRFLGKPRLFQRPLYPYNPFIHIEYHENEIVVCGYKSFKDIQLDGNVSSQFISGFLFALPFMNQDTFIEINPPFESKSYVAMTMDVLNRFQVEIQYVNEHCILVKGNQRYRATKMKIEGDYSQLAFFAALGLLNDDVKVKGVSHTTLQGDRAFLDIIQRMNGKYQVIEDGYLFCKSHLKSCDIDLGNCPDLGPILMVLASKAEGATTIYNAGRLRIKESDRIFTMEEELKKLYVDIESDESTIYIRGSFQYNGDCILDSHNDHRVVMALSILATTLNKPVMIEHAEAIKKSYPSFFDDLKALGISIEIYT